MRPSATGRDHSTTLSMSPYSYAARTRSSEVAASIGTGAPPGPAGPGAVGPAVAGAPADPAGGAVPAAAGGGSAARTLADRATVAPTSTSVRKPEFIMSFDFL